VDPRAGLDDMEKRKFLTLPGLELRLLGRPAPSQSLYRLRYPGSLLTCLRELLIEYFLLGCYAVECGRSSDYTVRHLRR
jgi:hypothetical protein